MFHERETYREILTRLGERFPGREAITIAETAALLGRCSRTVRDDKTLPKVKVCRGYLVPLVSLARWLSNR